MSPGLKIGLRVFGAASFPVLSYMPSVSDASATRSFLRH